MQEKGIKITVSGKKALDRLYDERGIKKLVIVGLAIEWLAKQDKTLQSVILGQADPVDTLAVLDMIRRRIEAEPGGSAEASTLYQFLGPEDRAVMAGLRESHSDDEILAAARKALSKVARSLSKATGVRRRTSGGAAG